MKKELQSLVSLQEKDIVLDRLRHRAEVIPKEIEAQNLTLTKLKLQVEELKDKYKKLQMAKKEKEIELETKENEIKKHNIELNSIKKNDAYKAMLGEIDKAKELKKKLEEEILTLMEESENEVKIIRTEEAALKAEEAKIQSVSEELNKELEKLKIEIIESEKERAEYVKDMPETLLQRYEHIRDGRQGLAIVSIEGDSCGGCYITLRPQIVNEVCKEQDLIFCDSCSRILYKK
ncbi:MAG: C4-type zinc ribbon domain-containing protein [Elusimicrobia bacterium]|nr:C4-type zinc ribbon domain-containing protein [Candidatus Liberimonas magnetica]